MYFISSMTQESYVGLVKQEWQKVTSSKKLNLYAHFTSHIPKNGEELRHTVRFSRKEHHCGAGPREGTKKEGIRGESRAMKIKPLFFTTHTSLISPVGASMLVTPLPYIHHQYIITNLKQCSERTKPHWENLLAKWKRSRLYSFVVIIQ